jgi:ABC-type ATPase with predicted acetyltransferase domain
MLRLKNLVFDDPIILEESIPVFLPTLELSAVYKPTPAFSPRILEVERQFSLGEIAEEFTVFKDFKLEFNDGDVIYITGESGGGKSTLLKAFKKLYEPQCIDMNEVKPADEEVLADSIGDDLNEALYLLNNVGLGEAWLFIRRYGELSDGQKYRYRLAKSIYLAKKHRVKALICDEFCSMLDRITAKIVAYLTQKVCRRFGLTLIVATAHEDLLEDLNPNILIVKPFQKPPIVKRFQPKPKQCSIMEKIRIEEGTYQDFLKLEVYHYKGFRPAFPKKIFRAVYEDEVVGVIVYTMSFLNNRGRVVTFGSDLKEKAKRGEILRIARVVVAPRFRGIGLGSRLVSETLEKTGAEIVETLAAMAVYNPFFEKAGMRLGYVYAGDEKVLRKYMSLLEKYGFDSSRMHSYSYLKSVVKKMPDETVKGFQLELSKIPLKRTVGKWLELKNKLKTGEISKDRLPTYLMQYATLQTKTYYYYWTVVG